jgi:hypothetical protein
LIDLEVKALSRLFRRRAFAVLAALGALCASTAVLANDRPFQFARTAILEDDDDQTWSFESWVQRYGSVRGVSIEPEYNFGAGRSVQVELGRLIDRNGEQTGQEGEVEFKQLFNYIGSDGWAWGVSAAAGVERAHGDGTVRHLNIKLPVSIALGAHAYLHLNPGLNLTSGSRRAFTPSAAIEKLLLERTIAFAEFARERELRFGQIGARHWLKREKLALDFALQQQRIEGRRNSGFILGLGVYDF